MRSSEKPCALAWKVFALAEIAAYLRIAADIRGKIVSGELAPGAAIPTHAEIQAEYGVSTTVARTAVGVLKSEGLVEGRFGSGVYVRKIQRITRQSVQRNSRGATGKSTSPFARDVEAAGHVPGWSSCSERDVAPERIAIRLDIEPGGPVMRTDYVFTADGEPVQVSRSWEPLALTGGTPVEMPEDGAAVGVVARFDVIGIRIDEMVEIVVSRPALPDELERLNLSLRGASVLAIERTYLAAGRPVETADIAFASDRYRLEFRAPVE